MKMKVGDMELSSGEGICFDSPKTSGVSPGEPTSQRPLSKPPSRLKPAFRIVAAAAFVGIVITIVAAFLASTFVFLIPLPGLSLLAVGALFVARRDASSRPEDDAGLAPVAIERRTRMLAMLERLQRPVSVEILQRKLQWTDEAILTTLRDLLANERITEDLDLESGHWVYQLNDESVVLDHESPRALPVEERLETITSSTQTTQWTSS